MKKMKHTALLSPFSGPSSRGYLCIACVLCRNPQPLPAVKNHEKPLFLAYLRAHPENMLFMLSLRFCVIFNGFCVL